MSAVATAALLLVLGFLVGAVVGLKRRVNKLQADRDVTDANVAWLDMEIERLKRRVSDS